MPGRLPFSREQFFDLFAAYNTAIWPTQIVALVLAVAALSLLWIRWKHTGGAMLWVLALFWAWTGIAYHILFFAQINAAAFGFGALFIVQAAMLLVYAWRGHIQLSYGVRSHPVGWLLIAYSLMAYPVLNAWAGHVYPSAPAFGVTPCPLVIFTLGVLLLSHVRTPWVLLAIPVLWSVIGGSAAFLLGVYPDLGLPVSAAIAVVGNATKQSKSATDDQLAADDEASR